MGEQLLHYIAKVFLTNKVFSYSVRILKYVKSKIESRRVGPADDETFQETL